MKFGILGDAKISREKLIPAIRAAGHEVVRLGRRDPSKAATDAVYRGVCQSDYDAVLRDPAIEAVYIPLPNHLHGPWSIKALEAGKAVLCEKPAVQNMAELEQIAATIVKTGCYFLEANMIPFHPQWDWLAKAPLGTKQFMQAIFSYPPPAPDNIRNVAAWAGGPVYDIGVYTVMAGHLVFGGAPEVKSAIYSMEPDLGLETQASALLLWPGGEHLCFSVSSQSANTQMVQLVGSEGWARLDIPFNPSAATRAFIEHDGLGSGQVVEFEPVDQYERMVTDFVEQVQAGRKADLTRSRIITKALDDLLAWRPRKK